MNNINNTYFFALLFVISIVLGGCQLSENNQVDSDISTTTIVETPYEDSAKQMRLDPISLQMTFSEEAEQLEREGTELLVNIAVFVTLSSGVELSLSPEQYGEYDKENQQIYLFNEERNYTDPSYTKRTIDNIFVDPTLLIESQAAYTVCLDFYSKRQSESDINVFVVDPVICFEEYEQEASYDVSVDVLSRE